MPLRALRQLVPFPETIGSGTFAVPYSSVSSLAPGGSTVLNLSDLVDFNFVANVDFAGNLSTFTFVRSDITSFSVLIVRPLGSTNLFSYGFHIATDSVAGTNPVLGTATYNGTSDSPAGTDLFINSSIFASYPPYVTGAAFGNTLTGGTPLAITSIPEPSPLGFLVLACPMLAVLLRRVNRQCLQGS